jgi:phosphatidylinositol alpha-1,6-mannosyltransferase
MTPQKGIALPNGFDLDHIEKSPEKQASRLALEKQFGLNLNGKRMLLTVGRQVKRKGHEWFITEVLPKIKTDIEYLAIGEGPEHKRLLEIAGNSPMKGKILFVGKQSDEILHQAYAASDVFIMPNIPVDGDMEGFGIVLLEANLAGTPAIAADLEGIKDVVEDGQNGFKIPVHDAKAFANKVDEVLTKQYENLSKRSVEYVYQNFAWDKVADKYISYLGKVIKEFNRSRG